MGRRISKEFLHPSILEGVNNKIGNLDSLETDAKGNMVQAINELVEKLDNSAEIEAKEAEIAEGKELIANAVGEPLTAEESFDEMSNDINGLLSTFKTNMMNNGITVESNDRFKSLIDKIATMVEEGSNKGIQYTSGVSTVSVPGEATTVTIPFNETLNYIPNIVFVRVKYYQGSSVYFDGWLSNNQSLSLNVSGYGIAKLTVDNVTEEQLRVDVYTGNTNYLFLNTSSSSKNIDFSWYAIGVGEEDTTLRDSLASILEEEGVSVTEEDDMASLIGKVDEEFENKNNTQFYESELIADNGKKYPSLTSTGNARTFTISPGFTPKTIIMKAYTLSSKAFMYVISHFHTDSSNYAIKSLQYAQNSSSYTDFYIWIDSFSAESVNCHIAVGDLDGGSSLSTTVYIKIYAIA